MSGASALRRVLFTCGNGESGQLGLGYFQPTNLFTAVLGLLDVDVANASCGNAHTAAVSTCGSVYTFGNNSRNQLGGQPDFSDVPVPGQVTLPDSCRGVSAGAAFTLAVTATGQVWGAPLTMPKGYLACTACSLLPTTRFRALDLSAHHRALDSKGAAVRLST